jgi:hypothetical protein
MGYEENGIFMMYLKRAMENRNILVTDMLERLKQNFKQEIPIEAKDQMPITSSSLAEPLSLYDPVDGSVIGTICLFFYISVFISIKLLKLLDCLISLLFLYLKKVVAFGMIARCWLFLGRSFHKSKSPPFKQMAG